MYLSFRGSKCVWSSVIEKGVHISQSQLINIINYLVDNIYVEVGDKVFRQCIGIPMGTDCAPLLANLYLFSYEYNFMKGLLKNNIFRAKHFFQSVPVVCALSRLSPGGGKIVLMSGIFRRLCVTSITHQLLF